MQVRRYKHSELYQKEIRELVRISSNITNQYGNNYHPGNVHAIVVPAFLPEFVVLSQYSSWYFGLGVFRFASPYPMVRAEMEVCSISVLGESELVLASIAHPCDVELFWQSSFQYERVSRVHLLCLFGKPQHVAVALMGNFSDDLVFCCASDGQVDMELPDVLLLVGKPIGVV